MNLSDKFQEYMYSRYPNVYRIFDNNHLLEQFTYALTDPAIPLIKKLEMMHDVLDLDFCSDDVVRQMYNNFGALYDEELNTSRQRKILRNIVDLLKFKGTDVVIEYIVSEITGIRTTLEYGTDVDDKTKMTLKLDMDYDMYKETVDPAKLKEILEEFVPFYMVITVVYAYRFIDSAVVSLTDSSFFGTILDNKVQFCTLNASETSSLSTKLTHTELGEIEASDVKSDSIKSSVQESGKAMSSEVVLSLLEAASPRNARFTLCDFGVAVFNNDTFNITQLNY